MSRDIRFRVWDKKEKNASTLFFYPGENGIVEIKDISSIVPVVWTGRSWDAANPDDSEEYVVITDLSSDDLYSLPFEGFVACKKEVELWEREK